MKIIHRYSGTVLFEHESESSRVAVRAALEAKADLSCADLSCADLSGADLSGANLDFSSGVPFWCGSFGLKADLRLAAQMAYHFCRIDFPDCVEAQAAQEALKPLANKFHRVEECGKIEVQP